MFKNFSPPILPLGKEFNKGVDFKRKCSAFATHFPLKCFQTHSMLKILRSFFFKKKNPQGKYIYIRQSPKHPTNPRELNVRVKYAIPEFQISFHCRRALSYFWALSRESQTLENIRQKLCILSPFVWNVQLRADCSVQVQFVPYLAGTVNSFWNLPRYIRCSPVKRYHAEMFLVLFVWVATL